MSRIATALLLVIVILFAYFAFYNQEVATLKLWKGQEVELPVVVVVLASILTGAVIVLLLFGIRGIGRTFSQIQLGIVRKRRLKAEELYNRGVDAHLSGKMPSAIRFLEEAVAKDPGFLQPFFRLGTVYLQMGEVKKAIELHRKALDGHPENLRVQLFLVDDYLAAGQPDEAVEILKKITAKDNSNQAAYESLRDIQEKEGDWKGAVESQNRLVKLSGKSPASLQRLRGLRYQLAIGMIGGGERDRGVRVLKDIMKEDPDFLAAAVTLGEAHIQKGRIDEGVKVLSEGYRRHRNPVFLQVLEENLLKGENPSRLVKVFQKLLDQSPDDVLLSLFYGKICLRLEMIDESYMALRKVESMGYESPLLFSLLGETSARRERYQEAVQEFRRSISLSNGASPRFTCARCGDLSESWTARCRSCGQWNSYALPGLTEPVRAPAVRPQYDTEE